MSFRNEHKMFKIKIREIKDGFSARKLVVLSIKSLFIYLFIRFQIINHEYCDEDDRRGVQFNLINR